MKIKYISLLSLLISIVFVAGLWFGAESMPREHFLATARTCVSSHMLFQPSKDIFGRVTRVACVPNPNK